MPVYPRGGLRERLIDQLSHHGAIAQTLQRSLRHEDSYQLVHRVYPEMRPKCAAPAIIVYGSRQRIHSRVCPNGKPQPKALSHFGHGCTCRKGRGCERVVHNICRKMSTRHQIHCARCEDPLTARLTSTQQHLAEAQIISRCRVQTGATRLPGPCDSVVRDWEDLSILLIGLWLRFAFSSVNKKPVSTNPSEPKILS
jgi:hypothetical protein